MGLWGEMGMMMKGAVASKGCVYDNRSWLRGGDQCRVHRGVGIDAFKGDGHPL